MSGEIPAIVKLRLALLVTMLGICQAETPVYFSETTHNPASFARAVNYYVALGRRPCVRELSEIAKGHDYRVAFLCRVLFLPKRADEPLRDPAFGELIDLPPNVPNENMPLQQWPLFPIAHAGKSYFLLSQHYGICFTPEYTKDYLDYCRSNGVFRKDFIPVPMRAEARRDALALQESPAWRAVKWNACRTGADGTKIREDYRAELRKALDAQVKAVNKSR